jgi:hypothetical protein
MRVLTIILVLAAALWSAAGWALFAFARSGPAAVTTLATWLQFEPGELQWLADALAIAGPAMQVVVVIVWLLGMAGIVALALFLPRVAREASSVGRAVRSGERPHLDPEVTRPFRR